MLMAILLETGHLHTHCHPVAGQCNKQHEKEKQPSAEIKIKHPRTPAAFFEFNFFLFYDILVPLHNILIVDLLMQNSIGPPIHQ